MICSVGVSSSSQFTWDFSHLTFRVLHSGTRSGQSVTPVLRNAYPGRHPVQVTATNAVGYHVCCSGDSEIPSDIAVGIIVTK